MRATPGLRSILTLSFGLMAAALAAALAWLIGHHASEQARRDAEQRLDNIARVASQVLELGLEERARDLDQLAYLHAHTPLRLDQDGDELLHGLQRTQPAYRWLAYVTPDGRVRKTTGEHWQGEDVRAQPWWTPAGSRLVLASRRDEGPVPHVFSLTRPVIAAGDSAPGLLVAQFGPDWAAARLDLVLTPARRALGIRLWLLDAEGRVIHAPADVPGAIPALGKTGAQRLRWPDGDDYLTAVQPLPAGHGLVDSGWQVVSRQPVVMAFAPVKALQLWIAFAGVVLTVVFAFIGLALARRLSQPLRALAQAADRLPRHGPRAPLPPVGGLREAAQLAHSFNHLLDDLHQHQSALATLNASLEQQVEQRTQALERANAHLTGVLAEREVLMQQLAAQARTDSLTGLLNRRAFDEQAQQALARAERQQAPVCVLVLDIDHFKQVNDRHGHDIGDVALKATASARRASLREVDLLARFGGEEFVVLLPDTGLADATAAAERLRAAVAALCLPLPDGRELRFTTSIGVAAVPDARGLDAALKAADAALYRAKQDGRNRVVAA